MATMTANRVPLTLEMAGALTNAVKSRLLALDLGGAGGDPFGLMADKPDLVKIERVAREMSLCAQVLVDLDLDGVTGPLDIEATDDLLFLIQRCEDDAYKAIEADAGGHADDLALTRARLTMLQHTYEHINELGRRGDV